MSVLVKDIEMPKNCYDCPFIRASVAGDYYCVAGDGIEEDLKRLYERRMSDCPLIEIPTPHGRLIDADAIQDYNVETFGQRLLIIDTAPTVIEAEE